MKDQRRYVKVGYARATSTSSRLQARKLTRIEKGDSRQKEAVKDQRHYVKAGCASVEQLRRFSKKKVKIKKLPWKRFLSKSAGGRDEKRTIGVTYRD